MIDMKWVQGLGQKNRQSEHQQQSAKGEYVLATGSAAANRLRILHSIYGPGARQLLLNAGIKPGMRVADLGCGVGMVTQLLAELVGRTGEVSAGSMRRATRTGAVKRRAFRIACQPSLNGKWRHAALMAGARRVMAAGPTVRGTRGSSVTSRYSAFGTLRVARPNGAPTSLAAVMENMFCAETPGAFSRWDWRQLFVPVARLIISTPPLVSAWQEIWNATHPRSKGSRSKT